MKKRFNMKKLSIIFALLLGILLICSACGKQDPFEGFAGENGIEIESIEAYSGPYVEDGSDEEAQNVMQLKVKNVGGSDIQLAYIKLADKAGNDYSFKITTLLNGESMVIFEENRAEYSEDINIVSAELQDAVYFDPVPDMHADKVAVSVEDGAALVCNVSDAELHDLYVYYKNYDGETAFGGITYRISVPMLAPGEFIEVPAAHLSASVSKLIFVTYGE